MRKNRWSGGVQNICVVHDLFPTWEFIIRNMAYRQQCRWRRISSLPITCQWVNDEAFLNARWIELWSILVWENSSAKTFASALINSVFCLFGDDRCFCQIWSSSSLGVEIEQCHWYSLLVTFVVVRKEIVFAQRGGKEISTALIVVEDQRYAFALSVQQKNESKCELIVVAEDMGRDESSGDLINSHRFWDWTVPFESRSFRTFYN